MSADKTPQQNIRNFCIIAHIDHGKSTLADRFLGITDTIDSRHLKARTLDSMELEQEKGITIKLKAVRMMHTYEGAEYQLNLIDTPGHVDFSYEVSRSLAACDGALLLVDASQGIQAQTVSNVHKALEANLKIIPVLNKIDLPSSEIERITADVVQTFGFSEDEILKVSAKTGEGAEDLLSEVIKKVPSPQGNPKGNARALVFDSFYDEHLGVVAAINVVDGSLTNELIKSRKKIWFSATQNSSIPEEIGIFIPGRQKVEGLGTGEVGYIASGFKDIHAVKVGDTVSIQGKEIEPLPGYKEINPFVFVSMYPVENAKFQQLREALEKLSLSDSALSYEPETNNALGFGFRCGFLGLFHADIIQERLEREYNLELISTTPTVEYRVTRSNKKVIRVRTPSQLPDRSSIEMIEEPWISANVVSPSSYVGAVMQLCEDRRGIMLKMDYPSEKTVVFEYELPLSELIFNFYDDLKSVSSGFASLDYAFLEYRKVNATKVDILVHGEVVDPLSYITLRDSAEESGRKILKKLKDVIPRQQFKVALQAAIGGKVIAREDIPAARKDVLAGIYGGHRERKDKLLERQKKGKARMKKFGQVSIPQEAFRQVLKN